MAPGRRRERARVDEPIGLHVRDGDPEQTPHLPRMRRQHARRGRPAQKLRRLGPERVERVGVDHHRQRQSRRQLVHDRRAFPCPVGIPGPRATACARASERLQRGERGRRVGVVAVGVARGHELDRLGVERALTGGGRGDRHEACPAAQRRRPHQQRRAGLAGRARHDQQVPRAPLVGVGAPAWDARRDPGAVEQTAACGGGDPRRRPARRDRRSRAARRAPTRRRRGRACGRPSSRSRRPERRRPPRGRCRRRARRGCRRRSCARRRRSSRRAPPPERRAPDREIRCRRWRRRRRGPPPLPAPAWASADRSVAARRARQVGSSVQALPSSTATLPTCSSAASADAASPRIFSLGAASSTRTEIPASASWRAATNPSPPFEPPPQTIVTRPRAAPSSRGRSRPRPRPAVSMSRRVGTPSARVTAASAARISAAVRTSGKSTLRSDAAARDHGPQLLDGGAHPQQHRPRDETVADVELLEARQRHHRRRGSRSRARAQRPSRSPASPAARAASSSRCSCLAASGPRGRRQAVVAGVQLDGADAQARRRLDDTLARDR